MSSNFGASRGVQLHKVGGCESIQAMATRMHYAKAYTIAYALMILISVIMIIWGLASNGGPKVDPGKTAYVALEIFVNVMLVLEVIVRMIAFGKKFWISWWNRFDVALTLVCVIVPLIFFTNSNAASKEFEEELDYVLILIRYLLPFIRLIMFIKKAKKAGGDHDIDKINFDGLDSEQMIDEEEGSRKYVVGGDNNVTSHLQPKSMKSIKRTDNGL